MKNEIKSFPILFITILACGIFLYGCTGTIPKKNSKDNNYNNSVQSPNLTLSQDGAWCWYQDPRAVYINGHHEKTYAQWMTSDGTLQIGSYDHKTQETITHTLKTNWDSDDHNVGSILVLPDNRLMVFYARHGKVGLHCRTSVNPEDITQWEDEVTISNTNNISYNHPVYLSDEKLYYVFWRGPSWKPTFSTSKDGKIWSEPKILIQEAGREAKTIRPYLKVVSDGKSSIHFTFTNGHPRNEPLNSVYYMKYENGKFFTANGKQIGLMENLPVSHANSDIVYNGKLTGIRAWVWDIALDEDGNPVIAYSRLPSETDHRYAYARWTGKFWLDVEITPGGRWFPETPDGKNEFESHYSGGISLVQSDPSSVYLSRMVDGQFEIEKWTTVDNGASWSFLSITKKSTQLNARPVSPRGYNGKNDYVLWMTGNYIHYTNYQTKIKMHLQQ